MTHDYHKPTHTLVGERGETYNATQVRLYGISPSINLELPLEVGDITISLNEGSEEKYANVLNLNSRTGNQALLLAIATSKPEYAPEDERSIGIIYGYAFEGHCYDLPRPMLMLIPALPKDKVEPVDPRTPDNGVIPSKDCDYDGRPGYRVWVVDKLDQCDVIDINSGFIEQLVLEANMPGKRSPSSYSAHMQFAHRSGRMPE